MHFFTYQCFVSNDFAFTVQLKIQILYKFLAPCLHCSALQLVTRVGYFASKLVIFKFKEDSLLGFRR